ncbi:hypothetical protein M409DRAFT_49010 [Zasmidium cellare ATCC 36951]|uniref:Uncharacterized protein n=1 Tax=Zasmidium cellare ATCC 36951 TaxID=1080233 RepID=A0A6A6D402_ZASCE|nr:uncharacterized protein M409DRAFT_49010 [Zasmidium cellare ATCC 36951]KAF2174141.1 hypothetical protein M409DRAFT_49010 [Zasmidium cellare ATCC 36951]
MWTAPPRQPSERGLPAQHSAALLPRGQTPYVPAILRTRARCRRFLVAATTAAAAAAGRGGEGSLTSTCEALCLGDAAGAECDVSAAARLPRFCWSGRGGVGGAAQRRVGVSVSAGASQSTYVAVRERSYQDRDDGVVIELAERASFEAARLRPATAKLHPEADAPGAGQFIGLP